MFQNITLEVSLKPFKDTSDEGIRKVAQTIFRDWEPLLRDRKSVSILFWTADGSEILDYAGDLSAPFEWCRFLGGANNPPLAPGQPYEISLHTCKQDYMKDAPVMTYGILKKIVAAIREEGSRAFPSSEIHVGETFDIGPEFALSDFKYSRHTEILNPDSHVDGKGFVDATATLHSDDRPYAAFPDGIPEGTPFGTFFGKQSAAFLPDMGFDFLWLSNGLGFSADPWKKTGKIFDGEHFYMDKLAETRKKVFDFWRLFREACPDIPIQTRGTNNSVGIDYATDGVPLWDLYNADLDFLPPPNSPWAALNDNYGLELMGHMTRIAEIPKNDFLFRYYIHDPWWCNSPWYDRYDNSPCDLYMPMSLGRINKEGKVESASHFAILSIDNSFGNMPASCVNEPLPHILKAEKDAPDAPAPLVWVYPMREFTTSSDEATVREMYEGDNYISEAINDGFPLSCVVSTDNYLLHPDSLYAGSVLIAPVLSGNALGKLLNFAKDGGKVIVYGTASMLKTLPSDAPVIKIDVASSPSSIREALESYGYYIRFEKKSTKKPPTFTLSRSDGAFLFSIYSADTTTDTLLKFPLGAPILQNGEVEIENGFARYRFGRSDHRECRLFVSQQSGVISAKERPPVSGRFRRRLLLDGLEDATVIFFPETYAQEHTYFDDSPVCDITPNFNDRFKVVHDPLYGTYYRADHVTGAQSIFLPFPNKL